MVLEEAGITAVESPAEVGRTMADVLGRGR